METGSSVATPPGVQDAPVKSSPEDILEDVATSQLGCLSGEQVGNSPEPGFSYIDDYDYYYPEPPPSPPDDNYLSSLDEPPLNHPEDIAVTDVSSQPKLSPEKTPISEPLNPDVPESEVTYEFSLDDPPTALEVESAADTPNQQQLILPPGSELRKLDGRESQHVCIVTGISRQEPTLEESIHHEDLLHIPMVENVEKEEIVQGDLMPVLSNEEVMLSLPERSTEEDRSAQQVESPEDETTNMRLVELPELNIHGENLPTDTVREENKPPGGENVVVRYLQDDNVQGLALLEEFKRGLSREAASQEGTAKEDEVSKEESVAGEFELSEVKRSDNTTVAKEDEQVVGPDTIAATPAEESLLESGLSKKELLKIWNLATKLHKARVAYNKNLCRPTTLMNPATRRKKPSVLRPTGRTRLPDPMTNRGVCTIGKGKDWKDPQALDWVEPLPKEIVEQIASESSLPGSELACSSKRFQTSGSQVDSSPISNKRRKMSLKSDEPVTLSDSDEELPDYSAELGFDRPKTEPVGVADGDSCNVHSIKHSSPTCTVIDSDEELPDYSVELGLARPKTQVQSSRKSVEVVMDGTSCTVVHSVAPKHSTSTCTLSDPDGGLEFSLEVDLTSRKTGLPRSWNSVEVTMGGDSCTMVHSAGTQSLAPTTRSHRRRRLVGASRSAVVRSNRNGDSYEVVTLESSDDSDDADVEVLKIAKRSSPKKAPSPEKPKPTPQPTDSGFKNEWFCPICLETKDKVPNMMSTICGHLFCGPCLESTIKINKQCPNCRKKLTLRQIHIVYL